MEMLYDNSITFGGSSLFPTGKQQFVPYLHPTRCGKRSQPRLEYSERSSAPRKIIHRSMSRGLRMLNRKRCEAVRCAARSPKNKSGQPGLRGAGRFLGGGNYSYCRGALSTAIAFVSAVTGPPDIFALLLALT